MNLHYAMREWVKANPWNRESREDMKRNSKLLSNNLSYDLKMVALKASVSVVGIVSYSDEREILEGSGFVIESLNIDGKFCNTILTTASILRPEPHINSVANGIKIAVIQSPGIACDGDIIGYDFHYNIAAIKFRTRMSISPVRLRDVDDSISIDPNLLDEKPPEYHPQTFKFNLTLGDTVLALGRNHDKEYTVMVVGGKFSIEYTGLDCKELLRAEFIISRYGIGGPIINCYGEVIGINFYHPYCTPFLPINIVSRWWDELKKSRQYLLPWHGIKLSNLYVESARYLEFVRQKFPNIFKGVVVREVSSKSTAYYTGIVPTDVIVECDGKCVETVLEFLDLIWDKAGKPVNLSVLRPSDGSRLNVTMVVGKVGPNRYNSWPVAPPIGRRGLG
ncbi:putative protease Do-like 14 isoform X2 [Mercurialis annua]|uniref:putative protease Do-like 14 isoform X2 n=1 Tax=Mercurialis annua TaxID=3986 RepID=UPI00215FAE91|nr:putative protease Do-like 14 isoform X2 [Mercurialis annua]